MTWFKRLSFVGYVAVFFVSTVTLIGVGAVALLLTLPDVGRLEGCLETSMYHVKLCPGTEGYAKLKDISPYVIHAVIASEDGSFYTHKGFDWHEMKESMTANLTSGGFRRGGSTLTQQLAKNVFLSQEKSLWRKLKEAYLASAIERRFDKNVILEKYLNVVEFGPELYGVKAAAKHYFHKAPADLHPLEAAWLAFLLPNPKNYSRSFAKGQLTPFSRKQVKIILNRMRSYGKLTPEGYETAIASIDAFPWQGVSLSHFKGAPSYSLETDVKAPPAAEPADDVNPDEGPMEDGAVEGAVDRLMRDDDSGRKPQHAPGPGTPALKAIEEGEPEDPPKPDAAPAPARPPREIDHRSDVDTTPTEPIEE